MALNLQNLRTPTSEEARKIGRKGGLASAKARKAVKTFKQEMEECLTPEERKAIVRAVVELAERGSLPHVEFVLEMIGEHPDQEQRADSSITISIGSGADTYAD